MALFTVILDFLGGTYIHQVRADSPQEASIKWAKQIDKQGVAGIDDTAAQTLIEEVVDSSPTSLDGIENVWCTTALLNNKLALINIVQTASLIDRK